MKLKVFLAVVGLFFLSISVQAQSASIQWVTIEEAYKKTQSVSDKKVFIDLYTDWCGWCKRMDATTFTDSIVVKILNQYYYPVKLNAEQSAEITLGTQVYKNPNPGKARSTHELAVHLLNGKMSYPSFPILDQHFKPISVLAGYRESREFEMILWYICNGDNARYPFEKYKEIYEKEIRPKMLEQIR